MNGNVELKRELTELKESMPTMTLQVQDLDHFDSIKPHLEKMKTFGEKLKLNELRMATIKDKIDDFAS